MKIAVIGLRGYPYPDAYGKILSQVGPRLVSRGHEVTLFVRRKWAVKGEETVDGMKVVSLPHVPTKSLDTLSYGLWATLVSSFGDFDVVHFHGTALSPFAGIPRILGKKSLLQVHALDWQRDKFGWLGRRVLRGFERLGAILPDHTATISKALQEWFSAEYGRTCTHIPQGVTLPPEREDRPPVWKFGIEGEPFVLYVGRLVPEKACDTLIGAFQKVNPRGKLVMAGEASYTSSYVNRLKEIAGPNVVFTGPLHEPDLDLLYSGASVYVQGSRVEGLSMALLEAMSYGIATIVSDIPANLEAVGEAALVFPVGNEERLSQLISQVFHDEALRHEVGKRCRARVATAFRWDSVVDATELLYRRLAGGKEAATDLEKATGHRHHAAFASGRRTGGSDGCPVDPGFVGTSSLLLRSSSDSGGEALSHVEAADHDPGSGDELRGRPSSE